MTDDVTPFPKPQKRIRATKQEWEAIAEAKQGRERKDGTCKTLDQIVPLLAHPERVRFEHEALP